MVSSIFSNICSTANISDISTDIEYDEININPNSYFDINNISYTIKKENNLVIVTILTNYIHETFTYYIGENPLTDQFKDSNKFTFDSLDTTSYMVAVMNEKGIIVIFDEINISNF